ncbi:UDP-N-acetylmuramoylalanine--D-glutamate ligase [Spirochaetota bacterium]|nr:UDP-N-acetylmuramoylalanine--D-glutamate ligase [Spirochaetota bacterium]
MATSAKQINNQAKFSRAKFIAELNEKNFLILGISRTGLACSQFFSHYKVGYSIGDHFKGRTQIGIAKRLKNLTIPPADIYWSDTEILEVLARQENIHQHKPNRSHNKANLAANNNTTAANSHNSYNIHNSFFTDVILSPGIPREHVLVKKCQQLKLPVWSDIDFFYPYYADKHIIGITGTDGKTTAVHLVTHLLNPQNKVAYAGNIGIPIAKLLLHKDFYKLEVLVLELSSYMLEVLYRFRANIAVILNIDNDHLDRYHRLKDYISAKFNILTHVEKNDIFLHNLNNHNITKTLSSKEKSLKSRPCQIIGFHVKSPHNREPLPASLKSLPHSHVPAPKRTSPPTNQVTQQISQTATSPQKKEIPPHYTIEFSLIKPIKLKISHTLATNLLNTRSTHNKIKEIRHYSHSLTKTHDISSKKPNIATHNLPYNNLPHKKTKPIARNTAQLFINPETLGAALSIGHLMGCSKSDLMHNLSTFQLLPHRMEVIELAHTPPQKYTEAAPKHKNHLLVINDSKATTVQAVSNALSFFDRNARKNLVLIMGGQNKNLDFTILNTMIAQLKALYLYGQASEILKEQFIKTLAPHKNSHSLQNPIQNPTQIPEMISIYDFNEAVKSAWQLVSTLASKQNNPPPNKKPKTIARKTNHDENTKKFSKSNAANPIILLLSPGCTSFDQFASYEERGNTFKALIKTLAQNTP